MRQGIGGFEDRFTVTRTDGQPIRAEARYFVLDYAGDAYAKKALSVYADLIDDENPKLAWDLRDAIVHPQDHPAQHD